jgi:hypothetical protein
MHFLILGIGEERAGRGSRHIIIIIINIRD